MVLKLDLKCKIDFKYLFAQKKANTSRKLYYFIGPLYLALSAI